MSQGQGSVTRTNKTAPTIFPAGAANNGLSVSSATHKIVMGNDEAEALDPAKLLSNREIKMFGHTVRFLQADGNEQAGKIIISCNTITDVNFVSRLLVEGTTITKRNAMAFDVDVNVDGQSDNFGIFVGKIPGR